MKSLFKRCPAALVAVTTALAMANAWSQGNYPSQLVRVIVPFGAGTGLDVVARRYSERLADQMKTPVVVENREGAGGTIGALAVAKAAPDGYTIVFTANAPFAVSPYLQAGTTYDPMLDFSPIAKVAVIPMVLVTGKDSPFKTFGEMAAFARANPGKLDYASSGIGTPSHLSMELIKQHLGLNIVAVPYKSTGQALADTMGGQIPLYMPSFPAALGQSKSHQVLGLAIGSGKRSSVMPDIPTVAEVLKQPGFEANVWYGFLAPRGTPPAVINRLNAEIVKAAASPQVISTLAQLGAEPALLAPHEFASQIQRDADSARKLLKSLGIERGQ